MKPYFKCLFSLIAAAAVIPAAMAKEGMWTPQQLPDVGRDMRNLGLKLKPEALTDLTGFPMGAVISLGGCTASFVSATGLIVTNHHCARGSIQYNSTAEKNYLETGFLANSLGEELPAAPGSRVYVTVAIEDVTAQIVGGEVAQLKGLARYKAIDDRRKAVVSACEGDAGHRCQVSSFYGGASFQLIKRLEIQDVRLVYAPSRGIGNYGGDIDNWQWPRHTGDFSFYRAYVSPDGKPAPFDADNVPYEPEHVLTVSASGLSDGDFVMAAGYPGSTQRYRRLSEVEHVFEWEYPQWIELADLRIETIKSIAPEGTDARVKYENLLAGIKNYSINRKGQIVGAQRTRLKERRAAQEAAFNSWASAGDNAAYGQAAQSLDALIAKDIAADKKAFWIRYAADARLLRAAKTLYRLAKERTKPDAERERGFQARDLPFIKQGLQSIERRYDGRIDKALWSAVLERYLQQPKALRTAAFDDAMGFSGGESRQEIEARISSFYAASSLDALDQRMKWLEAPAKDFEASDDAFIKLAVALYPSDIAAEEKAKASAGALQQVRAQYMDAYIAWQKSQGEAVYPDANSTLRVTYGTVQGGSPQDGLIYEPFTRLEGIAVKASGIAPFDAPAALLERVEAKDYGNYNLKAIGSVPVNFLTDLDSTGGNSGSPTLDRRGNLVGLLFDGTIESVNADWDFDTRTTRSIHVDTRYMLWVMEKVDGATRLLDEMDIAR